MTTPAPSAAPTVADLAARLAEVPLRDAAQLGRRLEGIRGTRDQARRDRDLTALQLRIDAAAGRVQRRRAAVPPLSYPPELPVSARREDLLAAIRDHQVVVVAGETGSGKTTQLPKICLELGRGTRGLIGHTQPRRLAARTIAERIAEELGTTVGGPIGYRVRFADRTGPDTVVKLMTDGVLLAEIAHDPLLLAYDTLIVDEAHERSLNIDFLLGYLTQLLPRRPDLKLIITSATIDTRRFSEHFGGATVVEVSGRTFEVQIRYRPLVLEPEDDEDTDDDGEEGSDDDADESSAPNRVPARVKTSAATRGAVPSRVAARDAERDQTQAVCDAVAELATAGPGDVLVFLSGEREIRDTADALARTELAHTEVLPLYARLSAAEQHRVFAPHTGRRVVLATNIAETSLTVPGIRYVVDPGTARISRYSTRLKVQRLPIEPVSRASADQRAGRCGRVADGICIRLYSEADYLARPEFTDPEILRTNLASVILSMIALGLGDIAAFPFLQRPDARAIRDGLGLLHELGALDTDAPDGTRRLSPIGRLLSELPVDPRLARIILAAREFGCVREAAIIAAVLSIQDPRERPSEHREAAAAAHARFADPDSDFAAYLSLWRYLREQRSLLSSNQFRRMCREQYLHYLRIREWQDLYSQLRDVLARLDIRLSDTPADAVQLTRAVLAGMLSLIGAYDGDAREYRGARGARFALARGTPLARRPPAWVVVAELVETDRLRGRVAARIDPEWVEPLAGHLVSRSYSEPHWSARRGSVVASEKVTLFGLPIVAARTVQYGSIDAELSRELFIRHALVEGDWRSPHRFLAANRDLLERAGELENRARRRGIVVDDETLFAFYDARIGPDVVSGRHFDAWWKRERRSHPDLLNLSWEQLLDPAAEPVAEADYPTSWHSGEVALPVDYAFEPGTEHDGVTITVPLAMLNQVPSDRFGWQVPGLRQELLTELIRSLPKPLRRELVPAPDVARRVLPALGEPNGPLLPALAGALLRLTGVRVPVDAFDPSRLPVHLRPRFRITDAAGVEVATGDELSELQRRLAPAAQAEIATAAASVERTGLRDWDFDELPATFQTAAPARVAGNDSRAAGSATVQGYPALVDRGTDVDLRVLASAAAATVATRSGLRRLLLLRHGDATVRQLLAGLSGAQRLTLSANPDGSVRQLLADCAGAACDQITGGRADRVRDRAAFEALARDVADQLPALTADVLAVVERVLDQSRALGRLLRGATSPTLLPSLIDVREQLAELLAPGFVTRTGGQRLPDLVRYLRAARRRLDVLPGNVAADRRSMAEIAGVAAEMDRRRAQLPAGDSAATASEAPGGAGRVAGRVLPESLARIAWMVQELRVNAFAQTIGTPVPVSATRIMRALSAYDTESSSEANSAGPNSAAPNLPAPNSAALNPAGTEPSRAATG